MGKIIIIMLVLILVGITEQHCWILKASAELNVWV